MMKQHYIRSIAAASALLLMFPCSAHAEQAEETALTSPDGMYSYAVDENGNASIYDLINEKEYTGALEIPSEIDGHPVTYIGNGAFTDASGITSVTIPAGVEAVGDCLFFGCTALESIQVEEGNSYLSVNEDGVLMADGGKFLYCYPPAKEGETYTVPDGVDELAPGCFSYTQNLKSVTVPGSVVSVDRWAFAYTLLEEVILEDGVYQLDDYAFAYSQSLRTVELGSGLAYIYDACFANCRALAEITLPDSLIYVGQYAFCGTSLQSVTIPASVEEICFGAFGYDSNLTPISSFTIHGTAGTEAQIYCTAVDEDNDYKNNFTFIAVDADGTPTGEEDTAESAGTDDNSKETTAESQESDTSGKPDSPDRPDKNPMLPVLLGIGGGAVVILAAVLGVLLRKKSKQEGDK